jgi:ABC-type sugar transport system ATPase subunit
MTIEPSIDMNTEFQTDSNLEPVIRLDGLTKRFKSNVALDSVSLEVPPGVVFSLLGENGT